MRRLQYERKGEPTGSSLTDSEMKQKMENGVMVPTYEPELTYKAVDGLPMEMISLSISSINAVKHPVYLHHILLITKLAGTKPPTRQIPLYQHPPCPSTSQPQYKSARRQAQLHTAVIIPTRYLYQQSPVSRQNQCATGSHDTAAYAAA